MIGGLGGPVSGGGTEVRSTDIFRPHLQVVRIKKIIFKIECNWLNSVLNCFENLSSFRLGFGICCCGKCDFGTRTLDLTSFAIETFLFEP